MQCYGDSTCMRTRMRTWGKRHKSHKAKTARAFRLLARERVSLSAAMCGQNAHAQEFVKINLPQFPTGRKFAGGSPLEMVAYVLAYIAESWTSVKWRRVNKCRCRERGHLARFGADSRSTWATPPPIPMSRRLATKDRNARSALARSLSNETQIEESRTEATIFMKRQEVIRYLVEIR